MRALAWEFPNEPYLASADRHFMLGDSLLIIPVLEPNAEAVSGVFPGESTALFGTIGTTTLPLLTRWRSLVLILLSLRRFLMFPFSSAEEVFFRCNHCKTLSQ